MTFEDALESSLFKGPSEKTFIDKLVAKEDVEKLRQIISKNRMSREDMMIMLNLLSSNEMKLLNYGEYDRYIMAKFFVWIREFVATTENLYDYREDLNRKSKTCKYCQLEKEKCKCATFVPSFQLSKRTEQIFDNCFRLMEHNIKFLVDLYLNLARTTLSLGATGLLELLKNKYEVVYPDRLPTQPQPQQPPVKLAWRKP